jgi:hypothetical protein
MACYGQLVQVPLALPGNFRTPDFVWRFGSPIRYVTILQRVMEQDGFLVPRLTNCGTGEHLRHLQHHPCMQPNPTQIHKSQRSATDKTKLRSLHLPPLRSSQSFLLLDEGQLGIQPAVRPLFHQNAAMPLLHPPPPLLPPLPEERAKMLLL